MFRIQPITVDLHQLIESRSGRLNIELPENYEKYTCTISTWMMFDPVITDSCGHTLERASIEQWQAQQKEQKGEHKEDQSVKCWCRTPILSVVSNKPFKNEIDQFLTVTQSQLEQDIIRSPNVEYDPLRQELILLISNFLKYGNEPKALERRCKAKYKEFFEELATGSIKEASKTAGESSQATSRLYCSLL